MKCDNLRERSQGTFLVSVWEYHCSEMEKYQLPLIQTSWCTETYILLQFLF